MIQLAWYASASDTPTITRMASVFVQRCHTRQHHKQSVLVTSGQTSDLNRWTSRGLAYMSKKPARFLPKATSAFYSDVQHSLTDANAFAIADATAVATAVAVAEASAHPLPVPAQANFHTFSHIHHPPGDNAGGTQTPAGFGITAETNAM